MRPPLRRDRQTGPKVLWMGLALAWSIAAWGHPDLTSELAMRVRAVVEDADVVYTTAFAVPCSEGVWEELVERPVLLGALWSAYGYAPAYRVEMRGDTVHVEDPTGLVGDVVGIQASDGERTYLVEGQINHWAVPFFNQGTAVFLLKTQARAGEVAGTLEVHVRAESAIGSLVVKLGRPLLMRHVANRIDLNLQDVRQILAAVAEDQDRVAGLLDPVAAEQLRAALR